MELEQFRQEAQRLKAGRRSGSLPFPETLRAFAVRYAEHTVAGGTVTDAAQKLGVSGPTLYEAPSEEDFPSEIRSAPGEVTESY